MFKLKEAKLIYLSLILFCQIFIIGIWSNPSLNASISPDSYDYITLSNNLFDENSNFRPPIYPLFLKLSSYLRTGIDKEDISYANNSSFIKYINLFFIS